MIGKVINSLLQANTSLIALVPTTSIYPYVLNENTPLPAIIYTIDSISAVYDKTGWVGDAYSFSVVSFSENYTLLQDIVSEVRSAIDLKDGTIEDIHIQRVELTGLSEGYNINENVYLNKLTFSTVVVEY